MSLQVFKLNVVFGNLVMQAERNCLLLPCDKLFRCELDAAVYSTLFGANLSDELQDVGD